MKLKTCVGVIDEAIDTIIQQRIVSGVSYAVIDDGDVQLKYCGVQGVVEPYCGHTIRPDMCYDLASLSKVIGTTTRMIQLLDQGRIALNTPVSDILPRFDGPGITVEHLLLHNSGLPAEIRNKEGWSRETITDYLYTTKPAAAPGAVFCYSDVGFILLGKMIEALDGTGLEESYQKHIFQPLAMHHTSFVTKTEQYDYIPTECTKERGCICGVVHDKKAYLLGPCGSAGLFSTLTDVTAFVQAYMDHSVKLFGASWFAEIEQREMFGRTLGWSKEYGRQILYHTGFTGTSILIDQSEKRALVILTNRIHPSRDNEAFLTARKQLNELFLNIQIQPKEAAKRSWQNKES